ncbi:MAG: hypothetical protein QMB51_03530 [Patescibacteria group bacterium]
MKIIERKILPFQEKDFFPPLRSKVDYARLLALSARMLLLDYQPTTQSSSIMKLVIEKMNRLFFYKEAKYFSVSFPFNVLFENDKITSITSYLGKEVDSKSISAIISILDNEQFAINPSLIDYYIDPHEIDSSGLFLLEEIFQFEPSYIRYDHDIERNNGRLHPLHHLDVNYSTYGTFKIGLNDNISHQYFEDLQNINTDCCYIN